MLGMSYTSWAIELISIITKLDTTSRHSLHDPGVEFQGRQHSGIEDARNTSKLVWKLVQDGCRLSHPQSKELIQGNPQATEENPQPAAAKKRYYGNRIYNKASMADVKIQAPTF